MNKEEQLDEIQLKALIETYTINEIAGLFGKIDQRVISLLDYSSDDFLKLSNDFKSSFKENSTLNELATGIYSVSKEYIQSDCNNSFKEAYDVILGDLNVWEYYLDLTNDVLNKMSNELRQIFFPLKNYKQNLMSLKFLLTNLKLSVNCNDDKCVEFEKTVEKHEHEIVQLKEKSDQIINRVSIFRKDVKKLILNENAVFKNVIGEIKTALATFSRTLLNFNPDPNQSMDQLSEMSSSRKDFSETFSRIITKLQYHDIISQKIVHIQETHRELIGDLATLEDVKDEEQHMHERAKFFLRVRDIAGLQAAQLLHSNKEYQSAVEIITNNFMDMGDNAISMKKSIESYLGKVIPSKKLKDLKEQSDLLHNLSTKYSVSTNSYIKTIKSLKQERDEILSMFRIISDSTNELRVGLSRMINKISTIKLKDIDAEKSVSIIYQLVNDMDINKVKQNDVVISIEKYNESFDQIASQAEKAESDGNNIPFESIKSTISIINDFDQRINEKFSSLSKLSDVLVDKLRNSVSKIKYYDYFDKVIEEIINELNTINFKLKSVESSVESKDDNLEKLRENYTMETEHIIHDHVTRGEGEINLEILENDDNIEFF